jgi:hypothetical protein
MGILITSLAMAMRFRYEILEKYRGQLRAMDETARAQACAAISKTLGNIEGEADSRGLLEKAGLIDVFETNADRDAIETMFTRWYEIRATLLRALEERDGEAVDNQLDALYAINRRFLDLATKRLATRMAAAYGTEAVAAPRQVRHRRGAAAPDRPTRESGAGVTGAASGEPALVGVRIRKTVQPGSAGQRELAVAMPS